MWSSIVRGNLPPPSATPLAVRADSITSTASSEESFVLVSPLASPSPPAAAPARAVDDESKDAHENQDAVSEQVNNDATIAALLALSEEEDGDAEYNEQEDDDYYDDEDQEEGYNSFEIDEIAQDMDGIVVTQPNSTLTRATGGGGGGTKIATRKEQRAVKIAANKLRKNMKDELTSTCPRLELEQFIACAIVVPAEEEDDTTTTTTSSVETSSSSSLPPTGAANSFTNQSLTAPKQKRIHANDIIEMILARADEIDAGRIATQKHKNAASQAAAVAAATEKKKSSRLYFRSFYRQGAERLAYPFSFARSDYLHLQYALYRFFRKDLETALHVNYHHKTIIRNIIPYNMASDKPAFFFGGPHTHDEGFMIALLSSLNDWHSGAPKTTDVQMRFIVPSPCTFVQSKPDQYLWMAQATHNQEDCRYGCQLNRRSKLRAYSYSNLIHLLKNENTKPLLTFPNPDVAIPFESRRQRMHPPPAFIKRAPHHHRLIMVATLQTPVPASNPAASSRHYDIFEDSSAPWQPGHAVAPMLPLIEIEFDTIDEFLASTTAEHQGEASKCELVPMKMTEKVQKQREQTHLAQFKWSHRCRSGRFTAYHKHY